LQRDNVTVDEFLSYVKCRCEKKSIPFTLSGDDFKNPTSRYSNSYYVTEGKKKCYTFNETSVTESVESAEDAEFRAEILRQFAHDHQIYFLCFDGSCYNEICKFIFDGENIGCGYYYQANKDAIKAI